MDPDGRHVVAVSPDGKLLWRCEVLPAPKNDVQRGFRITYIEQDGNDIRVGIWEGSMGTGKINKSTGAYTPPTITQ